MPNVVVVCADTFRADYLGCYGNPWIQTPHLDRLAAEGVLFEECYAEALPTIPARKAYLTGRPLFPHWQRLPFKGDHLSRQPGWHPLHEHEVTLPEIVGPAGVVTGMVCDTYHLFKPGMNLLRNFSSWQIVRGQEADPYRSGPRQPLRQAARRYTGLDGIDLQRSALPGGARQYLLNTAGRAGDEDYLVARVMRAAAAWLEDNATNQPFCLWVDCFDPHEPWDPPKRFADQYNGEHAGPEPVFARTNRWNDLSPDLQSRVKALYAGEVTFVDQWIGFLLDAVDRLGLRNDTAFVFTTDHGTILGEHGRLHKSPETLIAPETRLPLLVRLPGGRHAGVRQRGFVQAYDLLPTLLDILRVPAPPFVLGKSALKLLPGRETLHDAVVTAYNDHVSLRTKRWNLISAYEGMAPAGAPRLYDLRADPGETTDVAADFPTETLVLLEQLREVFSAPPPPPADPSSA
jgi:arylsulfatase A-like enzyme